MKNLIIIFALFISNVCNSQNIDEMSKKITRNCKTDMSKVKTITRWLSNNIKFENITTKLKTEDDFKNIKADVDDNGKIIIGSDIAKYLGRKFPSDVNITDRINYSFINRGGVCFDYSLMFHSMCKVNKIKSYIVIAYKEGVCHALNAVYVSNKVILIDATWYSNDSIKYFDIKYDFWKKQYSDVVDLEYVHDITNSKSVIIKYSEIGKKVDNYNETLKNNGVVKVENYFNIDNLDTMNSVYKKLKNVHIKIDEKIKSNIIKKTIFVDTTKFSVKSFKLVRNIKEYATIGKLTKMEKKECKRKYKESSDIGKKSYKEYERDVILAKYNKYCNEGLVYYNDWINFYDKQENNVDNKSMLGFMKGQKIMLNFYHCKRNDML